MHKPLLFKKKMGSYFYNTIQHYWRIGCDSINGGLKGLDNLCIGEISRGRYYPSMHLMVILEKANVIRHITIVIHFSC